MKLDESWIGKAVEVVVDRPLGSVHPHYKNLFYKVNYGYVPHTKAADGEAVDAYVLGPAVPLDRFYGNVVAVIRRKDDIEDKLVVAERPMGERDIMALTDFQEKFFKSRVIVSCDE